MAFCFYILVELISFQLYFFVKCILPSRNQMESIINQRKIFRQTNAKEKGS